MTSKCNISYNGKLSCSSIVHLESLKILRTVSTDSTKQDSSTGKFWYLFMNCYATFVYLNCHPFIALGHYLYFISKTTNIAAKKSVSKTFPLLNFKLCPKGLTKNRTTYL